MSTEDEKAQLDALGDALRERGVNLTEDGKVRPLSALLDDIAQEGGGVLDLDTAIMWAERVRDGEDLIVSLATDIAQFYQGVKVAQMINGRDSVAATGVLTFLNHLTDHLTKATATFLYGTTEAVMLESAKAAGVMGQEPKEANGE